MLSHRKKHTESLYKCQFCHRTFSCKRNLNYHIRKEVCRKASIPVSSSDHLPLVLKTDDNLDMLKSTCPLILDRFFVIPPRVSTFQEISQ
jgi:hypothetical protein